MVNEFEKEKYMPGILRCKQCGKELGEASFKVFSRAFRGYTIYGKRELFCDENCYNEYWDQYLVEEYKNNKIYKITRDGITGYVPYIGCSYYFKTLEDCKDRIDKANISVVDMNAFHYMNNQIFGK